MRILAPHSSSFFVLLLLITFSPMARANPSSSADSASPPSRHSCGHGQLGHAHAAAAKPALQRSSTLAQPHLWRQSAQIIQKSDSFSLGRRMQEQSSTNFPPTGWHPLRIHVDWTYSEEPEKDVYSGKYSMNRTCLYEGQEIALDGAARDNRYCLDSEGKVQHNANCWIKCTGVDVVNKAKLAKSGSILEKLKKITKEAQDVFASMLAVPDRSPDSLDFDDPSGLCGGYDITPHTMSGVDFYLYATLRPLHHMGETVAFALACRVDAETGRPFMGHMNVAPSTLLDNPDLLTVLLHELAHALGFSPHLYNQFRHPQDRTQTYYNYSTSQFPTGPFKGTGVAAADSGQPNEFKLDYTLLRMPNTGPAPRLKWMGPNAIAYAKEYFACDTIDGVEWENGGDSQSSTATHWEKRILYQESMTATQNIEKGKFTKFSTRFFQDTGFYEVNFTFGDEMHYGKGEGCDWVTDCGKWSDTYKCTTLQDDSRKGSGECNFDRTSTGYCNLLQYSSMPEAYRYGYVPGNDDVGGNDFLADQCAMTLPFSRNGEGVGPCTDPSNYPLTEADNVRGVRTGPTSRCYKSQVAHNNRQGAKESSLCFQTVCTNNKELPMVRVGDAFYPCYYDDQVIDLVTPKRPGSSLPSLPSRSDSAPPPTAAPSVHSEWYYNWKFAGHIRCGAGLRRMCQTTGIVHAEKWPNLTKVEPSEGLSKETPLVTVHGENMESCVGVYFGGTPGTNLTVMPDGKSITVNVPAIVDVPSEEAAEKGGLGNSDGEGPTNVELYCQITGACPGDAGCSVAHLRGGFNYTEPPSALFSATNWIKDFLGTTMGKVIGGAIGIIVLILLIVIIKSVCEGGDDKKQEKERKRKQQQQRGVLNAPTAAGASAGAAAGAGGYGYSTAHADPRYGPPRRAPAQNQYEDDLL